MDLEGNLPSTFCDNLNHFSLFLSFPKNYNVFLKCDFINYYFTRATLSAWCFTGSIWPQLDHCWVFYGKLFSDYLLMQEGLPAVWAPRVIQKPQPWYKTAVCVPRRRISNGDRREKVCIAGGGFEKCLSYSFLAIRMWFNFVTNKLCKSKSEALWKEFVKGVLAVLTACPEGLLPREASTKLLLTSMSPGPVRLGQGQGGNSQTSLPFLL